MPHKKSFIMTILLGLTIGPNLHAASDFEGYDIIVVAGQSNAVGYGGGNSDVMASDPIESKIQQIGREDSDDLKVIPVSEFEALHHWSWKKRKMGGMAGFALPFARRYAKTELAANRKVLIVPTARGGSAIQSWAPGQTLYDDMKSRVNVALKAGGLKNRIVVFMWQQGETDIVKAAPSLAPAKRKAAAVKYGEELKALVGNVRSDFKSQGDFPFLIGEPSRKIDPKSPIGFAETQANFVTQMIKASRLSCNGFVHSDDLEVNVNSVTGNIDETHFSAPGMTLLGQRYLKKWQSMTSCRSPISK